MTFSNAATPLWPLSWLSPSIVDSFRWKRSLDLPRRRRHPQCHFEGLFSDNHFLRRFVLLQCHFWPLQDGHSGFVQSKNGSISFLALSLSNLKIWMEMSTLGMLRSCVFLSGLFYCRRVVGLVVFFFQIIVFTGYDLYFFYINRRTHTILCGLFKKYSILCIRCNVLFGC